MKKLFCVLLCLVFSGVFAQHAEYKKYYDEGIVYYDDGNYLEALNSFLKAYKIDSSNANINFQVGYCYLRHPSSKHLAEAYLEKATKDLTSRYEGNNANEKQAPLQALLWLGEAYHLDYKFDKAEEMMKKYEDESNIGKKDKEEYAEVERLRKIVQTARKQVANAQKITIENMGDSINSQYPDFSPVLSADERMILFTYRGPKSTGGITTADGQYFEDVFVSYRKDDDTWTEAKSIGDFVNTIGHEASVSVTPDGQTLIIYKDDNGDGNLYYSEWKNGAWGTPISFGDEVNTKYWETHACMNNTKDVLYFVSDRPGGLGGRDIYRSKKLPNGHWGKPVNLGSTINTPYDEDAPFLHSNGEDFYFASQGHGTMGNFDIFKSSIILGTDSFTKPVALPYPINTTDDDVFFVLSPDNRRAYYASSHEDKSGHGEKDIYRIYMPDAEEPALVLFLGTVVPAPCDILPNTLEVQVTEKETGQIVGIYRPRPESGDFTMILFPNKTYVFSYMAEGNEVHNDIVSTSDVLAYQEIHREVQLKPVQLDGTSSQLLPCVLTDLNITVYDDNVSKKPVSNAHVVITDNSTGRHIKGYTNDKGKLETKKIRVDQEYNMGAKSGKKFSQTVHFNSNGYKPGDQMNMDIYMEEKAVATTTKPAAGKPANYKCFFKYNKNKLNYDEENYLSFIKALKGYIEINGSAELTIFSSASKVPTKTFRTNEKLAKVRAEKTEDRILESLKKEGIDKSKIKFVKVEHQVGGPDYNNDFEINQAEYEKFQFVEVSVIK